MLEKQLELLRSGNFLKMPHHHCYRRRSMDFLLFWVLNGKGYVATEGQRYPGGPGDLFCLLRGREHEYGSDRTDPWDILWVHFQGALASTFVKAIRGFGGPRVFLGADPEIRDRWIELVIVHAAGGSGHEIRVHSALYALLGLIVYRLGQKRSGPASTEPFDVHRIQSHIHRHLKDVIALEDLAREARLSVPHFTRVFRTLFKVSPMQYVLQQRVALASSLLTETSMPLKNIAESVGCPDPYYFSRLFKKMMGTSPTEYRREKRLATSRESL